MAGVWVYVGGVRVCRLCEGVCGGCVKVCDVHARVCVG